MSHFFWHETVILILLFLQMLCSICLFVLLRHCSCGRRTTAAPYKWFGRPVSMACFPLFILNALLCLTLISLSIVLLVISINRLRAADMDLGPVRLVIMTPLILVVSVCHLAGAVYLRFFGNIDCEGCNYVAKSK